MATKRYRELLQEILKIPEIKDIVEKNKLKSKDFENSFSIMDLFAIYEKRDNLDYSTTIYIDSLSKKLQWRYIPKGDNIQRLQGSSRAINYQYFNFSPSWLEIDIKKIKPTNGKRKLSFELLKIKKAFKIHNEIKGLYVWGKRGIGKSHVLTALLNSFADDGFKVAQVYLPELFTQLKGYMGTPMYLEIFENIKRADVLLLDDLGSEVFNEWSISDIIIPILHYRNDRSLLTFITATTKIDDYQKVNAKTNQQKERVRNVISKIKSICNEFELI